MWRLIEPPRSGSHKSKPYPVVVSGRRPRRDDHGLTVTRNDLYRLACRKYFIEDSAAVLVELSPVYRAHSVMLA